MAAGVMALAMPAVEDVMCCWARGSTAKGAANWKTPNRVMPEMVLKENATLRPVASTQTQHPMAPIATRSVETVSGP